jgi:hypothetical protein
MLQVRVVVDRHAVDPCPWRHSPLALLDDVPHLVGQVTFLPRCEVTLGPAGDGVRRLIRTVMDSHVRR